MTDTAPFWTALLEDSGNAGRARTACPTMGDVIAARFSRRAVLRGSMAATAIAAAVGPAALLAARAARAGDGASRFAFAEVAAGVDDDHHVAEGYEAQVLLRWGDPIFADSPAFDPAAQTRRGAGAPVRLQQRLRGLRPAADGSLRARAAGGQPRVHRHRT